MKTMTMSQLDRVREEGGEYLTDLEVTVDGEPVRVLVAGELEVVHPKNWLSRGDSPPDDPETTGSWEIIGFVVGDDREVQPGTDEFDQIEKKVRDEVSRSIVEMGL